jgi:hypothetical protein
MNNTNFYKRHYSPRFSETASTTVRRLAWALGLHMTKTVELMVQLMPSLITPSKVCLSYKDKTKCGTCTFHPSYTPQQKEAALMALSELII